MNQPTLFDQPSDTPRCRSCGATNLRCIRTYPMTSAQCRTFSCIDCGACTITPTWQACHPDEKHT